MNAVAFTPTRADQVATSHANHLALLALGPGWSAELRAQIEQAGKAQPRG